MNTIHSLLSSAVLGTALFWAGAASGQVTLPFTEGFEGTSGEIYRGTTAALTGAPEWSYSNTDPAGRLRTAAGAGFYANGSAAMTLDRDPSGTNVTNYLTLTLDMTNYTAATDEVRLNFSFAHHGEENNAGDRVWVRGSSADPYVEIVDLFASKGATGVYVTLLDIPISTTLVGAGQGFSATTQIRFGQEDNFPATSITVSDGFSFDDIEVFVPPAEDMEVSAILAPTDDACGLSTSMIDVEVQNLGSTIQSGVPVTVVVSGDATGTFTANTVGPQGYRTFETVSLGPIDLFSAQNITIQATVQLPNDLDTSNDSLTEAVIITPTIIAVGAPGAVCPGSSATLSATPEPNVAFAWYDVATGGTALGAGDTFSTPIGNPATSFWVERDDVVESVGPNYTSGGSASYTAIRNYGLAFTANEAVTLDSFVVHTNASGTLAVDLLDITGAVVDTAAVPVIGNTQPEVVVVDLQVPSAGDYTVVVTSATTPSTMGILRNTSGYAFPYNSQSGAVSITGNVGTTSLVYYQLFYSW